MFAYKQRKIGGTDKQGLAILRPLNIIAPLIDLRDEVSQKGFV
jgi:hypothetical protein